MNTMQVGALRPGISELDYRAERTSVGGAFFAYVVDMFDIFLPVLVLLPAIAYFEPHGLSSEQKAVLADFVFAASLIGRPLGALIAGHLSDTIGRRRTTLIVTVGFTVATFLIALLPGFATVGLWSVGILIALRFIGGVFLGGAYTAANPLAMEACRPSRRGLYAAIINSGFSVAYAMIALFLFIALRTMSHGDLTSFYTIWGWRIGFVIGGILSVALFIYYKVTVSESAAWQQVEKRRFPIGHLFRKQSIRSFLQVFLLMSGVWFGLQTIAAILPRLLKTELNVPGESIPVILLVTFGITIVANIVCGILGQRYGRRRVLLILSMLAIVPASILYYSLIAVAPNRLVDITIFVVIIFVILDVPFAIMPAYINERFPVSIRGSGYGLGFSLSVVIPSFYAVYQGWLGSIMNPRFTVVVLVVGGGVLFLLGTLMSPETNSVDMSADLSD